MLLVIAIGGNALLERGEAPLADVQRHHVRDAVRALAPLAADHDLVITHGNGPQVGLLATESALDPALSAPYPLDVLGAETQGMVGYLLLQALENELPGHRVVSLICQTEVAADDPAFSRPTKFVGPVYAEEEARRLEVLHGWRSARDGASWRRVVASPEPVAVVELATIRSLVGDGAVVVVCEGGGGIPVTRGPDGSLRGVEAVIDKDRTAALMARELGADALVILTDVANVETDYGTAAARPIGQTTTGELRALSFPAGSMGPKIDAACRFVDATGKPAMIGRITDAVEILAGTRGTVIGPAPPGGLRPRS